MRIITAGGFNLKSIKLKEGTVKIETVKIKTEEGKGPFKGWPHKIPGKILAADFDMGGEGVAYHDTEQKNKLAHN